MPARISRADKSSSRPCLPDFERLFDRDRLVRGIDRPIADRKQAAPGNLCGRAAPSEIAPEAASYPFIYSADDRVDLGRMLERHHPDPSDRLGAWARAFVRGSRTDTQALLADLNAGVKSSISYQSRETEGTQTPVETLDRGWGSCRDLAMLLIEAARCLGFGARVVTGYLYNPTANNGDTVLVPPMLGPISTFQAPVGLHPIRQTEPSTAAI